MASTSSTSKGFFSPYVTLKRKNGMLIDCRNSMHCIGGTEYCYDEMFTEQGYKYENELACGTYNVLKVV